MYGNNYQYYSPHQVYNVPNAYVAYPEAAPPPSFGYYDDQALRIDAALTPCCQQSYDPNALRNYVRINGRCPHDQRPLAERDIRYVSTQAAPAPVRAVHHAAQPQLSLLDRLWNGVKAVARCVVKLTVAAFKLIWEVVKFALKVLVYTTIGLCALAVVLNPTPAGIIALSAIGLLVAAYNINSKRCNC